MSRTNIADQIPVGPYPTSVGATALDLVWTAADVSNHNEAILTGKEVLLVWNTDSASHNLTITSLAPGRARHMNHPISRAMPWEPA